MLNVLILAASETPGRPDGDYPLCVTEINGKPLLQLQIERLARLEDFRLILAVHEIDCRRWHLDNVARLLWDNTVVLEVAEATGGAACTALLAADWIDTSDPLLIMNGNELLDVDAAEVIEEFQSKQYDAGVVTFRSIHPRYSYVRLSDEGLVIEAAEKNPISSTATAGFYWFIEGKRFVWAAQQMILKGAAVHGSYYVCPSFNELVLEQARIGVRPIEPDQYHPLKSGRQIELTGQAKPYGGAS
jgi:NDP-sugar pyrophosphorylase family protein